MATIVLPCWVRESVCVRACVSVVCVCDVTHMHVHTCARSKHTLLRPKVYNRPSDPNSLSPGRFLSSRSEAW